MEKSMEKEQTTTKNDGSDGIQGRVYVRTGI